MTDAILELPAGRQHQIERLLQALADAYGGAPPMPEIECEPNHVYGVVYVTWSNDKGRVQLAALDDDTVMWSGHGNVTAETLPAVADAIRTLGDTKSP